MTFELDTHAVSAITDHAFVPRGEWWTVCGQYVPNRAKWACNPLAEANYAMRRCGLAEAAHASTTLDPKTPFIDHEGTA
jgi:hypothetical protein